MSVDIIVCVKENYKEGETVSSTEKDMECTQAKTAVQWLDIALPLSAV